jgi:GGDEF domain-containing protein
MWPLADNSSTAETLLQQADVAMYRVKARAKNHYEFYGSINSSGAT